MLINCIACGVMFIAKHKRVVYCSKTCRDYIPQPPKLVRQNAYCPPFKCIRKRKLSL